MAATNAAEGLLSGGGIPQLAQPVVPHEGSNDLVSKIAKHMYAAKHITWRGPGELIQLPWAVRCSGLVVVLDLWSGFSGTLLALLALGVRVVALAAESNADAKAVAAQNFPSLVHVEWVESVSARDVRPLLLRRKVTAILVGGGSPCQGNSALNRKRRNLEDPRSCQPQLLREIFDELSSMDAVKDGGVTVLMWLENVSSATWDTKSTYDKWLGASRIRIDAKHFGWVARDRCFWGRSQHQTLAQADFQKVPDATVSWETPEEPVLRYTGSKPIPRRIDLEDGFSLRIHPAKVMSTGKEAIFPFTREFWHPADPGIEASVSPDALERWHADARRFPAKAYEEHSLAWRGAEWRTLSPQERAMIHGFPARVVQGVPDEGRTYNEIRAIQNTLIGNGFHIPSLMLFFLALFTLVPQSNASPTADWAYNPEERGLRDRVRNTVFQPGLVQNMPGTLDKDALLDDVRRQLHGVTVSTAAWVAALKALRNDDVVALQTYWVDTQLRHLCPSPQGPEWKAQASRAALPASLGTQRFPGNSSRGLDHLLQPGLGRDEHLRQARTLPSPFKPCQIVDDDVAFCSRALAIMGPFLIKWRQSQEKSFKRVANALSAVSAEIQAGLDPKINGVAGHKRPAVLAAVISLLRWPDREQASDFIHGFQMLGEIMSHHVFRQLGLPDLDAPLLDSFWGPPAEAAVQELLRSKPPAAAQSIFKATTEEQERKWLGPFMDARDLDNRYGPGGWRFIPRFLLKQRMRDRVIDDGKRGGQNQCTRGAETIYAISVDWLGECISSMTAEVAKLHCQEEASTEEILRTLPSWFCPTMGVDDLPDAYRGCPIRREDQPGCIIALWHPDRNRWVFAEAYAMLFGLSSAVTGFNRHPTLLAAAARRFLASCVGAFFDDLATVGCNSGNRSEQRALQFLLSQVGSPEAKEKTAHMAMQRSWLGTCCNLGEVTKTGYLHIGSKDSSVAQVCQGVHSALCRGELRSAAAAKLRGQANWTGSNAAGRCGRIGLEVLKRKQYSGTPALSAADREGLAFLATVALHAPERSILVVGARPPPVVCYTDASFEEMSGKPPRLGWVLFDENKQPIGQTADVSWEIVQSWTPRRVYIFPAEAFAAYAAVWNHREMLRGKDILIFIDNEAAAAALIRGSSAADEVNVIAQSLHWLLLEHNIRMWIEWVDSESNVSDGLSRDGLEDAWTMNQNWCLSKGCLPPWRHDLRQHIETCKQTLELGFA